jgi:hypothetical protein
VLRYQHVINEQSRRATSSHPAAAIFRLTLPQMSVAKCVSCTQSCGQSHVSRENGDADRCASSVRSRFRSATVPKSRSEAPSQFRCSRLENRTSALHIRTVCVETMPVMPWMAVNNLTN